MKIKQEFSSLADHGNRHHDEISFLKCQLIKNTQNIVNFILNLPETTTSTPRLMTLSTGDAQYV